MITITFSLVQRPGNDYSKEGALVSHRTLSISLAMPSVYIPIIMSFLGYLLFLRGGATDFRATQSTSVAAAAATSMISSEAHESFIRSQGHSAITDTRHYRHLLKENSAGVTAEGKEFSFK